MKCSRSKTIFQIFGWCNRCELWFRYFVWVKTSITMMNIIKIIHGPSWIVFILRIYDFFKLDHKECKSRCNSESLGIKNKAELTDWVVDFRHAYFSLKNETNLGEIQLSLYLPLDRWNTRLSNLTFFVYNLILLYTFNKNNCFSIKIVYIKVVEI